MEFIEFMASELKFLRQQYDTAETIYEAKRDDANKAQKQVNAIARRINALEETMRAYDGVQLYQ